ncbi:PRA1 family protein E [Ziziphus jujuba]|uniref:PRA1 family protein n=1 Tax=Ziziphus jujuba TaxID=326968 RepID=A0A9B4AG93_ZIZJJ|nr:PRA1 family protein E [Ziziphus jujuba]
MAQDDGARLLEFFNCPSTFGEATKRVEHNPYYFRISYSIAILYILLIRILWHPLSIVIFAVCFLGWLAIGYVCNVDPNELINCTIDYHVFMAVLWVLILFALISTGFWLNVLVSILIGSVEDLYYVELIQ